MAPPVNAIQTRFAASITTTAANWEMPTAVYATVVHAPAKAAI